MVSKKDIWVLQGTRSPSLLAVTSLLLPFPEHKRPRDLIAVLRCQNLRLKSEGAWCISLIWSPSGKPFDF